jgi:protein TonB
MSKHAQTTRLSVPAIASDLLLWGVAALAVGAAHAGVAFWVLHEPDVPAFDAPPPAIMIELSALPEATETQETELSQDTHTAQASQAVQEVVAPESPTPPETPVEEPVETPDDVAPAPDDLEREAEVALLAKKRPKPRPARESQAPKPQPKEVTRPQTPRPQQSAAASPSAVEAQNQQAQQSNRNAAAQSARGSGRSMSPAKWQARLGAHLERFKPRSKGERGTAYVTFSINATGHVSGARLARSSGDPAIDQAAISLVKRASPVPQPPPSVPRAITVPIKFQRR